MRARELADRRHEGEQLSDLDDRLLDSHLAGCSGCTAYVARLEEAPLQEEVPAGNEDPSRARVAVVEDESREGVGASEPPSGEINRPEEPLAEHEHHEPSSVDAMGQDKHRQIVGQSYGPTRQRQLAYYGIFIVFVILVYIGASFAISQGDQAPATNPDKAPWSKANAPNAPLGGFSTDDKGGVTHFQ